MSRCLLYGARGWPVGRALVLGWHTPRPIPLSPFSDAVFIMVLKNAVVKGLKKSIRVLTRVTDTVTTKGLELDQPGCGEPRQPLR